MFLDMYMYMLYAKYIILYYIIIHVINNIIIYNFNIQYQ